MNPDLEQAKRGDRYAMARLVDTHYDVVFRFCARRIGSEIAQDMAQETFITAQKSLRKFEGRSSFQTWLLGIAHNHVRNELKRRKAEPVDWTNDVEMQSPEEQLIDRESLRKALRALSAEHREVVLLHEVEQLTYDEMAEVLGIPSGTAKSRLHHAILQLRNSLMATTEVTA